MATNLKSVFAFCVSLNVQTLHATIEEARQAKIDWLIKKEVCLGAGANPDLYSFHTPHIFEFKPGQLSDLLYQGVEGQFDHIYGAGHTLRRPAWLTMGTSAAVRPSEL